MGAHVRSPYPTTGGVPDPGLTVPGYVLTEAARHGNKTALIDGSSGNRLSYHTLVSSVRRLASGLHRRIQRHHPDPGDPGDDPGADPWGGGGGGGGDTVRRPVVCLYAANCLQYPVVVHAVLLAGATITTADAHLSTDELTEHFQLLLPDFIIADHDKVDDARFAASRVGVIKEFFVLGKHLRGHVSIEELLRDDGRAPLGDVTIDCKNDVTIIPFDVDSHGEPVAVMHSHHTFNSTVSVLGCPSIAPVSYDDVVVCCHQLATMIGLTLYCGSALREGATCIILPEVTHRAMLDAITKFKASVLHITPGAAEYLASDPRVPRSGISGVRRIYCSGAPLREGLIGDMLMRCGVTEVREGFGTSGAAAILCVARGETLPGYVGKVCPHTEVQIRDILFGGVVEWETFGEVCVRGPQVMLGQLCKSEPETDLLEDGWLHTGQIGQVDNTGNFTLLGNIDNLIDYNGLKISPIEVERVVRQHPDVDDVVVVGMDNHGAGQVPRAYVMKKPGADVIEADIRDYVADQVVNHKRLRGGVMFVNDVPRAATGEPLRHKLQAEANRPRELEISLGECAQWPPDGSYIEDMRILQQETENIGGRRASTSTWEQMVSIDSLNFSAGMSPGGGIPEVFEHSVITFEDDLDGFITTRPKDKTKSHKDSPFILPKEEFTASQNAAVIDSMNWNNLENSSRNVGIPMGLDSNNNENRDGNSAPWEPDAGDAAVNGQWSSSSVPDLAELSVDCQLPIGTSTPKHSPQIRLTRSESRRPFDTITSFDVTDYDVQTTMEDSSRIRTRHHPPSPVSVTSAVVKTSPPVIVAKEQVQSHTNKKTPKSVKPEKTRRRRPSLEEAMNFKEDTPRKSRSPSPTTTSIRRRNFRSLGGNAWRSTGDITTSLSFNTELEATPEKSPPKKGDAKFKAAENIRLRAMEYSQQVRRREQEKRTRRNYGPLTESRVSPILHKSPPSGLKNSSPSLAERYNCSFTSGSNRPYPNTRTYPTFSLTKRYDMV